jgi:hypothetical protein
MTKNLKKDLQAVNREIKALSKKVEKVIVAVDKLDKAKAVKAKPVRKAAVKKPAVKAKPVKKVVVKKPAAKKTTQLSAVDTALGFIKRSKKGVDTATLMKKTGFDQKKVYNIIYKLNKLGRIKSVGKGVYLKA